MSRLQELFANFRYKVRENRYVRYALIALVIIAVISLCNVISYWGYRGPIKNSFNLINKKCEDALQYGEHASFKETIKYNEMEQELLGTEYYVSQKDYIDGLNKEYGENYKVKYKIAEVEELDEEKCEAIEEFFVQFYEIMSETKDANLEELKQKCEKKDVDEKDIEKLCKAYEKHIEAYKDVDVTKVYKVQLKCKISGSVSWDEFVIEDIMIAKINGKWLFVNEHDYGEFVEYILHNQLTPEMVYAKLAKLYR